MDEPKHPARRDERDPWEAGWEAKGRRKLVLALEATPAERLAWLEEMILLAFRTGALPKKVP